MLFLFSILNYFKSDELIYWILTFISDSIQWNLGKTNHLINEDKKYIISHISRCVKSYELFNIWSNWINFLKTKKSVKLNSEILLINQLIFWNKKIK